MKSPASRYHELTSDRDPYLRRARDAAKLTIPALMPEEGSTSSTRFYSPFQSVGARGVNNLASKLLLSLLPQQSSFFRLQIDEQALEELTGAEDQKAQMEEALARIERIALSELDASPLRTEMFEAFKQLIVSGNVLVMFTDDGFPRVFRMDHYVVRRDPMGKMIELIIREPVDLSAIDPKIAELVTTATPEPDSGTGASTRMKDAGPALYTCVHWDAASKLYRHRQYINDVLIPQSLGTYPADRLPFMPLRFIRVGGEDYGRGYIEEYYGDLRSLEGLEKLILKGSAASAKVLFLVAPNGTTRIKDITTSDTGDVRSGNANDVTVMQTQKAMDLRVAREQATAIEQRLGFAFLLNSAIQRSGERVTAEEIRFMARELEDALGGIYSIMTLEFQRPLLNLLLFRLQQARRIPKLPKGSVKPTIVTGLEALGRGQDLARLDEFIGGIPPTIAQAAVQRLNVGDYLTRRATALGLAVKGLVRSEQEVAAEQQQAVQAEMARALVDKGAGPAVKAAVEGGGQPPA